MFKVLIGYPTYEEELDIATKTTGEFNVDVNSVIGAGEILALQKVVRRIPAAEPIVKYALDLVRATRPLESASPQLVKDRVAWGAGPRAVQFLIVAAKARAALRGNLHVSTDDIRALAAPVLRHRVVTNFAAQAEGYTPDKLIADLLDMHDPHGGGLLGDSRVNKMINA
ncbi:MAG: hypothetical protein KDA33_10465 [Phycisphaerales bacterium]|nr:hypothetical protein [Phycisphaerales bacterium]